MKLCTSRQWISSMHSDVSYGICTRRRAFKWSPSFAVTITKRRVIIASVEDPIFPDQEICHPPKNVEQRIGMALQKLSWAIRVAESH